MGRGTAIFVIHTIPPVYNSRSRVLMLGSFPSPKSREAGFFYGHPQNRFWKVVSGALGQECPLSIEEKRTFLLKNGIAVWDVLYSCDIDGAKDTSISNPVPNNLEVILSRADIKGIFATGGKAYELYCRLCEPVTGIKAVKLPSTSPANAAFSEARLIKAYSVILEYL